MTRNYKDIWSGKDISYSDIYEKYEYCKSHRVDSKQSPSEKASYFEIIRNFVINGNSYSDEFDMGLMQILNWIALWETNRIIEVKKDSETLKNLLSELQKAGKDLNDSTERIIRNVLEELLDKSHKGIDLPMASTIMCFYNPELCPIIDRRADRAIFDKYEELREHFNFKITDPDKKTVKMLKGKKGSERKIEYYIYYVNRCHKFVEDNKEAKMMTIDKFLYQIDRGPNKKDNPLGNYEIGQWMKNQAYSK